MPPEQPTKPLQRYPIVNTRDPEEMRHAMLKYYGADRFTVFGSGVFEGRGNYIRLDELSLGLGAYGSESVAEFPEADFARLQISISGVGSTTTRGVTTNVDARQFCVSSPDRKVRFAYSGGYQQLVLRFHKDLLLKKLTALLGFRPKGNLEFESALSSDTRQSQGLLQLISFCFGQLDRPGESLPPPVVRELEQAIVVSLLCATRHGSTHLLDSDAGNATPNHVRRAEEFIEANWQRAIEIDELAGLTGIGARMLARAFLSHRGYSPRVFAKLVRMRHARAMLEVGGSAATVTAIGFKCGFGNLGHFARDYCEMFGELPSVTLERAQRLAR